MLNQAELVVFTGGLLNVPCVAAMLQRFFDDAQFDTLEAIVNRDGNSVFPIQKYAYQDDLTGKARAAPMQTSLRASKQFDQPRVSKQQILADLALSGINEQNSIYVSEQQKSKMLKSQCSITQDDFQPSLSQIWPQQSIEKQPILQSLNGSLSLQPIGKQLSTLRSQMSLRGEELSDIEELQVDEIPDTKGPQLLCEPEKPKFQSQNISVDRSIAGFKKNIPYLLQREEKLQSNNSVLISDLNKSVNVSEENGFEMTTLRKMADSFFSNRNGLNQTNKQFANQTSFQNQQYDEQGQLKVVPLRSKSAFGESEEKLSRSVSKGKCKQITSLQQIHNIDLLLKGQLNPEVQDNSQNESKSGKQNLANVAKASSIIMPQNGRTLLRNIQKPNQMMQNSSTQIVITPKQNQQLVPVKSNRNSYHLNTDIRNLIKNSDNDLGSLRSSSESEGVVNKPNETRQQPTQDKDLTIQSEHHNSTEIVQLSGFQRHQSNPTASNQVLNEQCKLNSFLKSSQQIKAQNVGKSVLQQEFENPLVDQYMYAVKVQESRQYTPSELFQSQYNQEIPEIQKNNQSQLIYQKTDISSLNSVALLNSSKDYTKQTPEDYTIAVRQATCVLRDQQQTEIVNTEISVSRPSSLIINTQNQLINQVNQQSQIHYQKIQKMDDAEERQFVKQVQQQRRKGQRIKYNSQYLQLYKASLQLEKDAWDQLNKGTKQLLAEQYITDDATDQESKKIFSQEQEHKQKEQIKQIFKYYAIQLPINGLLQLVPLTFNASNRIVLKLQKQKDCLLQLVASNNKLPKQLSSYDKKTSKIFIYSISKDIQQLSFVKYKQEILLFGNNNSGNSFQLQERTDAEILQLSQPGPGWCFVQ